MLVATFERLVLLYVPVSVTDSEVALKFVMAAFTAKDVVLGAGELPLPPHPASKNAQNVARTMLVLTV